MASPVTASTRTVYTVAIGGKQRRFLTAGAAWYALAKALLGGKYLSAWRVAEEYNRTPFADRPTDAESALAERCQHLFFVDSDGGPRFNTDKWQAYVRRVARKLRALHEHRAKAVRL